MIEVGRLCVKIAGRDAGKKCVVVDLIDDNYVMIDGETRRRKCNVKHLEPLKEVIKIKKGADRAVVASEFKRLGIELAEKKSKKAGERPTKQRKAKKEPKPEAVPVKKAAKKAPKPSGIEVEE